MSSVYADALCHVSGEILIAVAEDGEVLYWNDGATAVLGHGAAEAAGRRLADVVDTVDGDDLASVLEEAWLTHSAVWTVTVRRKDGSELRLEAVLRRIEPGGWISIAGRDVSDRIRLTRELLQRSWELESRLAETRRLIAETERLSGELVQRERLAAIGELAAGIGHDLRNPLAAIKNAMHYMARRLDTRTTEPRILQYLDAARKELGNCEQTIGGLLDYARDAPMAPSTCAVGALVAEAMALVARPPHVSVEHDVAPDLPTIEVDVNQIRRVLVNLIQNACEAISPARPGGVRIAVRPGDGGGVVIRIADDGEGIAPETRARLFDPLFTTKARGTGLGLAVVARLIERHGGEISVDSTPGVGSVFTVRLP